MEKQMNNVRSARTPMLPESFGDNKSLLLLSQVQVKNKVNNRSTLDKPMTTSGNKHLRH
jgi:hypothetical protein